MLCRKEIVPLFIPRSMLNVREDVCMWMMLDEYNASLLIKN